MKQGHVFTIYQNMLYYTMARKKRMESIGYYHIVNRGVERRKIFMDEEDHLKFLEILEDSAEIYFLKSMLMRS